MLDGAHECWRPARGYSACIHFLGSSFDGQVGCVERENPAIRFRLLRVNL